MIKGIGIDIVEHNRIKLKIAAKILTINEYQEFNNSKQQLQYLASRFAIKEAIIKATDNKYYLKDIEITNSKTGKPQSNIKNIHISITHEQNYSAAVAVWEEM